MAPNTDEKGAAEYGREALSQFRDAARYGAKALAERKATRGATKATEEITSSVKDQLPLPRAGGGAASELGELADAALARFGKKGKLASKIGVGHRIVDRLLPDPEEEAGDEAEETESAGAPEDADSPGDDEHLFDARTPIPIQESIDVAVPVAAAFDLCLRFEELPRGGRKAD